MAVRVATQTVKVTRWGKAARDLESCSALAAQSLARNGLVFPHSTRHTQKAESAIYMPEAVVGHWHSSLGSGCSDAT